VRSTLECVRLDAALGYSPTVFQGSRRYAKAASSRTHSKVLRTYAPTNVARGIFQES